jgi:hypothetical protein
MKEVLMFAAGLLLTGWVTWFTDLSLLHRVSLTAGEFLLFQAARGLNRRVRNDRTDETEEPSP